MDGVPDGIRFEDISNTNYLYYNLLLQGHAVAYLIDAPWYKPKV
jgi:hypothetical protein